MPLCSLKLSANEAKGRQLGGQALYLFDDESDSWAQTASATSCQDLVKFAKNITSGKLPDSPGGDHRRAEIRLGCVRCRGASETQYNEVQAEHGEMWRLYHAHRAYLSIYVPTEPPTHPPAHLSIFAGNVTTNTILIPLNGQPPRIENIAIDLSLKPRWW